MTAFHGQTRIRRATIGRLASVRLGDRPHCFERASGRSSAGFRGWGRTGHIQFVSSRGLAAVASVRDWRFVPMRIGPSTPAAFLTGHWVGWADTAALEHTAPFRTRLREAVKAGDGGRLVPWSDFLDVPTRPRRPGARSPSCNSAPRSVRTGGRTAWRPALIR